jgi:hypothetical protein
MLEGGHSVAGPWLKRPRARLWTIGLVAVALLAAATAARTTGGGGRQAPIATPNGPSGAEHPVGSSVTQPVQHGRLPADAAASPSTTTPGAARPGEAADLIAVGELHGKRLYAVPFPTLLESARRHGQIVPSGVAASPIVGSPSAIGRVGPYLVIANTNVRTLVRLDAHWNAPKELSVAEALHAGNVDLYYGAVVPLSANQAAVSVAFGAKVGIVVVDVARFEVVKAKVFEDRSASFPPLCRTDSGKLFLVSGQGTVDVLDGTSLERLATAGRSAWFPTGAACVGPRAWVSDDGSPTGRIYDEAARQVGSFDWAGTSSAYLTYSPAQGRVFGSDSGSGRVFSCPLSGGRCATSAALGKKPTDLLVYGDYLLVTLEDTQAVAVVRAADLGIEGVAGFPGLPRTVTLLAPG